MLWERNQLLVLTSRVGQLSDITFVGNRSDNLLATANIIWKRTRTDVAIAKFVNNKRVYQRTGLFVHDASTFPYKFSARSLRQQLGLSIALFYSIQWRNSMIVQSDNLKSFLHNLNPSFEVEQEIKNETLGNSNCYS